MEITKIFRFPRPSDLRNNNKALQKLKSNNNNNFNFKNIDPVHPLNEYKNLVRTVSHKAKRAKTIEIEKNQKIKRVN